VNQVSTNKMKTIWIGVIPSIFGYGICVASETQEKCFESLEKAYEEWRRAKGDGYDDAYDGEGTPFEKAMDHWGGRVSEIVLNECYFDDFGY
jgi:hypothetical protein